MADPQVNSQPESKKGLKNIKTILIGIIAVSCLAIVDHCSTHLISGKADVCTADTIKVTTITTVLPVSNGCTVVAKVDTCKKK